MNGGGKLRERGKGVVVVVVVVLKGREGKGTWG